MVDSNSTGKVATVVIEMEPGWVVVKVADPKPAPGRIEFFLRRTIEEWFNTRPAFVIDREEAISNHGEMLGINVWYHVAADRLQHDLFNIEVHEPIAQRYSKEYIEAVVADAMKVLPSPDTLVVVNPRRIAVILDHQARRVAVIPVDLIEQVIDDQMKRNLLAWLASPATSFYVMYIAGSWFRDRGTE